MNKCFYLFLLLIPLNGCGIYSFTGDSIDYTQVNTISISTFYNDAGNGPPNLNQTFTEALRDYYVRNSKLKLTESNGDLQLEGSITRYETRLQAPVSSSTNDDINDAGLERLTISVKAKYVNTTDDTFDFDKSFSFYADYDPNKNSFISIEDQLIEEITDQLVIDIFNASVANW